MYLLYSFNYINKRKTKRADPFRIRHPSKESCAVKYIIYFYE